MDIEKLFHVKANKKNVMDEFEELKEIGEELDVKRTIIDMVSALQLTFFNKSTILEDVDLDHADAYNIYIFSCFMCAWSELNYSDEDEPDNKDDYYELVSYIVILLNGNNVVS